MYAFTRVKWSDKDNTSSGAYEGQLEIKGQIHEYEPGLFFTLKLIAVVI